ncbi:helix-turn-helix transcriptional regulator [Mycolicibacter algericus]|uniref:LuxR family transcriptional regulator n=1 Tax=Mycolicibacter algericus TaxID=1288388 RepID=A0A7I9Y782_MYCAL|nr:LuxR family transcriptional regulator [Mycolicibacter algericus]GFG84437.1 LuxR family transcriptional regulator [Mycolicibacter algericus]
MRTTAETSSAWPIVGRDDELRAALATLGPDSEYQGIALVGDSGVGKSTLARALGARLTAAGRAVRFVLGTQTGFDVPLGAFSRSVTVDATCEPAAMLAIAHQNLAAAERPVIVVDDAQLLDPLSATLIYQLAAEGTAQLIVVIRSGETLLDAVTALLKEQLLLSMRINPFTREQTGELARRVLGGVVSAQVVNRLHDRSGGSPLYLRGLLRAGRDNGVLVLDEYGWQLKGPLHADQELSVLLGFRLQALTPDELEALEILAVAELLDWEVFRELCSSEAVSELERHRLIHLTSDGGGTLVQVTHPIFGEAVLERIGVVRSRRLNGLLFNAFDKYLRRGGRRLRLPDVRGRIRMAQFMICSDLEPDFELIIGAAVRAAAMSNLAHAEELARFAFDRDGGLPAALVLGDTLLWQGRGDEAESVLTDVGLDGADSVSIVDWACVRASNLFWNCGEIDSAQQVLAEVRGRAHSKASTALVHALETAFAFFTGDLATALRAGPSFCEADVSPTATALAALPTAHALAKTGRFGEVTGIAQIGLHAAARSRSGMIRFGLGVAEVTALVDAGDYSAAERAAERYATMAAGVPESDAMVGVLVGLVHLARGQLPLAASLFQDSTPVLTNAAPSLWPMLANAWSAQAEAARGNAVSASIALRHCEEAYGPQIAAFLPEVELARAWERVAHGQTSDARSLALRAAQIARRSGMAAVEMRALHTAVRFGDRSHADRLADLAEVLDAPLPNAIAAHARGLADRNADLLSATSDRFAIMGAFASAADAAAQASSEYGRAGQRGKQLELSTRTQWLAGQGEIRTPAVAAVTQPLPITDREREIAMLVAAGLPNRQIADRLSVSVRTVDGHLYRMFAKLGITRRDELIRLLDGVQSRA